MSRNTDHPATIRSLVRGKSTSQDANAHHQQRDPSHQAGPRRDDWMHERLGSRRGRFAGRNAGARSRR